MKDYEKYAEEVSHAIEGTIYWCCTGGEWTKDELRPLAIYVIQSQIQAIEKLLDDIEEPELMGIPIILRFYNKAIEHLKQKI